MIQQRNQERMPPSGVKTLPASFHRGEELPRAGAMTPQKKGKKAMGIRRVASAVPPSWP